MDDAYHAPGSFLYPPCDSFRHDWPFRPRLSVYILAGDAEWLRSPAVFLILLEDVENPVELALVYVSNVSDVDAIRR